jgi:hypothetical protein
VDRQPIRVGEVDGRQLDARLHRVRNGSDILWSFVGIAVEKAPRTIGAARLPQR